MKDRTWRDRGKRGRNHQIVPILKATTVCLAKIRLLSFNFPTKKAPSCYIRPGDCWDHAKRLPTKILVYITSKERHTPKRRPNRHLRTCTFTLLLKCSSPFSAHHQQLLAQRTTHDDTTHMCSQPEVYLFCLEMGRLKHSGPSASSSCRRTGPWI